MLVNSMKPIRSLLLREQAFFLFSTFIQATATLITDLERQCQENILFVANEYDCLHSVFLLHHRASEKLMLILVTVALSFFI